MGTWAGGALELKEDCHRAFKRVAIYAWEELPSCLEVDMAHCEVVE